ATVILVACEATPTHAVRLAEEALGAENVLVCGDERADLPQVVRTLAARGLGRILCEGGPHLMRDAVASGSLDELCLTLSPTVVGGDHPRILAGAPACGHAELTSLIEADDNLLGRWRLGRDA